jgi:hypothetical protein
MKTTYIRNAAAAFAIAACASAQNAAAYDIELSQSLGTFSAPFTVGFSGQFGPLADTDGLPGISFVDSISFDLTLPMAITVDIGTSSFGFSRLDGVTLSPGSHVLKVSGMLLPGAQGGSFEGNVQAVPVPEPGTYAMLFAGLGMLGLMVRRRMNSAG